MTSFTWTTNALWEAKGEPIYLLGLVHFSQNGHEAFGHSGGGIGAGCDLYYFPEKNLYYFIAINLGTVTDSPLHVKLLQLRNQLFDIMFK